MGTSKDHHDPGETLSAESRADESEAPSGHDSAPSIPFVLGEKSSLARIGFDGGITLGHSLDPRHPKPTVQNEPGNSASAANALTKHPVEQALSSATGNDKYVVSEEIARGGMGVVVRAVDRDARREVAMKLMRDDPSTRERKRFIEEAQVLGQLEHPNIVPMHDLGVDANGRLFFTMKLVRGKSLAAVLNEIRRNPDLENAEQSLPVLLNAYLNVCNAVAFANSKGVVHRDLKPANIMLGNFGEVLVMDWGLAKVGVIRRKSIRRGTGIRAMLRVVRGIRGDPTKNSAAADAASALSPNDIPGGRPNESPADIPVNEHSPSPVSSQEKNESSSATKPALSEGPVLIPGSLPRTDVTLEGTVSGTPAYMPPEQARGETSKIDERSDVYSMGAILYEILTLSAPVEGKTLKEVLTNSVQGRIVTPEQRAPRRIIPKELSAIAMMALSTDADDRYQSIEALRKDVDLFIQGHAVSAKPDTFAESVVKLVRRNKAASVVIAAAAVLLLVVLGISFYVNVKEKNFAQEGWNKVELETKLKDENYQKAIRATQDAEHARDSAEQAAKAALKAHRDAEYEAYAAKIALAAAKIDANAFSNVEELLDSCPRHLRNWEWGRLKYLCPRELITLTGLSIDKCAALFSPDGKEILTGGTTLWDANTGKERISFHSNRTRGAAASVNSAVFSPDGKRVLFAGNDSTATLWDTQTGIVKSILKGHSAPVWNVVFSFDGTRVLTVAGDKTARLWDAESGSQITSFAIQTLTYDEAMKRQHAIFSPDGKRILTISHDPSAKPAEAISARLWDSVSGAELRTLGNKSARLELIAYPGNKHVLTGNSERITAWDPESGNEILSSLPGATGMRLLDSSTTVRLSADGSRALTLYWDDVTHTPNIHVWDTTRVSLLGTLVSSAGIGSAGFSPDGALILTRGLDGTASIWNVETREQMSTVAWHSSMHHVVFSPEGSRVLTSSSDGTARVWNAYAGKSAWKYDSPTVAFAPDGPRVLVSHEGANPGFSVLNAATGHEIAAWSGAEAKHVLKYWLTPDGKRVVAESIEGRDLLLWEAGTGKRIIDAAGQAETEGRKQSLKLIAFAPDSQRVLLSRGNKALLRDLSSGKDLYTFDGTVKTAIFSPDCKLLATSSSPGSGKASEEKTRIWDLSSGKELAVIHGGGEKFCFSPDSKRLLCANGNTLTLCEARSGKTIRVLKHSSDEAEIICAEFSADGKQIAAGGNDHVAAIWDTESGIKIAALKGHAEIIQSICFSPDGTRVLTGSWDQTAKVWDARGGRELLTIKGRPGPGPVPLYRFSPDGKEIVLTSYATDMMMFWPTTDWNK